MAYGFLARNKDNEVVINDSEPLYVRYKTGQLSHTKKIGAMYGYRYSAEMKRTGADLLFIRLSKWNWVSFFLLGGASSNPTGNSFLAYDFFSSQPSVGWSLFTPRDEITERPSGYGMAVYNRFGQPVWDSTSLVGRIVNGGTIISASIKSEPYRTSVQGGNAVAANMGNASIRVGGTEAIWLTTAWQASYNEWLFSKRRVYGPETGSGFLAHHDSDYTYLLAWA